MYIKLKLEMNEGGKSPKDGSLFEIDNEATIEEMKYKLREYVGYEAADQEIKTLNRTFKDYEKVYDIFNGEHKEGTSVMLYTGLYEEPIFYCFLQLFSSKEAALRQEFDRVATKYKPIAMAGEVVTLDDSSNSEGTDSEETSDSQTDDSDSGSSTASSEVGRKQRKLLKSKQKEIKTNCTSTYPSTIQSMLFEDFNNVETKCATVVAKPPLSLNRRPSADPASEEKCRKRLSYATYETPPSLESPTDAKRQKLQENQTSSTTNTDGVVTGECTALPSTDIEPEKREYIVVIQKKSGEGFSNRDFEDLCQQFFELFRQSDNRIAADLEFVEKSAVLYKGCVYVGCNDETTCEWMLSQKLPAEWSLLRFRDYWKLQRCTVVIPGVSKTRNLQTIFSLLEAQNPQINTGQWIVQERRIVSDDTERVEYEKVSCLCEHEVLNLFIDEENRKLMEKSEFKLKYCFWKVLIKMAVCK